MRADTILINAAPGETRVALLAKGAVLQVLFERDHDEDSVEGGVFAGRVTAVNRDLNAAFVDIGGDEPGFLAAADARRSNAVRIKSITEAVSEGDKVLVQADREAMDGKGPRLTCRLTLGGRFVVLHQGGEGMKFSRFLAPQQRKELGVLEEILPVDCGLSFTPAAGGAEVAQISDDLDRLLALREDVFAAFDEVEAAPEPLLAPLDPVERALALAGPRCRVIADDPDAARRAEETAPGLKAEVWSKPRPLFEEFGVEEILDGVLEPVVTLPSGGRIVISETSALTAIDVDTGRTAGGPLGSGSPQRLAAKTNREAVTAIARELRLRNLAGQVLIDFLAMKGKKERQEILAQLRDAVSGDPVECHVLGYSGLGLAEMTRRRRGPSLMRLLGRAGGWSADPVAAGLAALRGAIAARGAVIGIAAAPDVAEALAGPLKDAVDDANRRTGGAIRISADAALAPGRYEIKGG
jgi:Rne/Rng family ribonuclease